MADDKLHVEQRGVQLRVELVRLVLQPRRPEPRVVHECGDLPDGLHQGALAPGVLPVDSEHRYHAQRLRGAFRVADAGVLQEGQARQLLVPVGRLAFPVAHVDGGIDDGLIVLDVYGNEHVLSPFQVFYHSPALRQAI